MYRVATLVFLLLVTVRGAGAQPLARGDDIRLRSAAVSGRFTVAEVSTDVITVNDSAGRRIDVDTRTVRRLEVLRGRRSAGTGFVRGAAVGGGVGGAMGMMLGYADGDDPPGLFSFSKGEKALLLGVVMGGTGALAGGLLGLMQPGERWERIVVDSPVLVDPGAGALRVGFVHRF